MEMFTVIFYGTGTFTFSVTSDEKTSRQRR